MLKSYSERLERGWPLLIVETEVNGDSKSTNERGSSLVGLLGLPCRYKRFLPCLGCSSQPSTNIFSLTIHYFNSCVPIAQQAGHWAGNRAGSPSLSMCLWSYYTLFVV
jgi:hypothetical protein